LGTREGAGRTAYFLQSGREQIWRCYDHERLRETRRRRCARAEGGLQRRQRRDNGASYAARGGHPSAKSASQYCPAQLQHERVASANKALLASENHGRPAIAVTASPASSAARAW
jgi:hypothetical protein